MTVATVPRLVIQTISRYSCPVLFGLKMIKQLVMQGVTNFMVMDSCCVTSVPTTSPINERLTELKKVSNSNGIHFTADGHKNMSSRLTDCLKTLINKPNKPMKQITYFWRGFRSHRGSSLLRNSVGTLGWPDGSLMRGGSRESSRGGSLSRRPRGFHPYRKW